MLPALDPHLLATTFSTRVVVSVQENAQWLDQNNVVKQMLRAHLHQRQYADLVRGGSYSRRQVGKSCVRWHRIAALDSNDPCRYIKTGNLILCCYCHNAVSFAKVLQLCLLCGMPYRFSASCASS